MDPSPNLRQNYSRHIQIWLLWKCNPSLSSHFEVRKFFLGYKLYSSSSLCEVRENCPPSSSSYTFRYPLGSMPPQSVVLKVKWSQALLAFTLKHRLLFKAAVTVTHHSWVQIKAGGMDQLLLASVSSTMVGVCHSKMNQVQSVVSTRSRCKYRFCHLTSLGIGFLVWKRRLLWEWNTMDYLNLWQTAHIFGNMQK